MSTTKFTRVDYDRIYNMVFDEKYPGYRPHIVESPNGDGKLDTKKRYAHVATKYLRDYKADEYNRIELYKYLQRCHSLSLAVADALDIPANWRPNIEYGALRIIDYPPGAITHPHTDFNLFTLMMYRDQPDKFRYLSGTPGTAIRELNQQLHYGELTQEFGIADATEHEVVASDETQRSIVYFALPDHAVRLPSGRTVGEYIEERVARSRYDA